MRLSASRSRATQEAQARIEGRLGEGILYEPDREVGSGTTARNPTTRAIDDDNHEPPETRWTASRSSEFDRKDAAVAVILKDIKVRRVGELRLNVSCVT